MDLTLQSVNMSKAILTENDFKATIAKGLSSDCAKSDPEIKKSKNGLDTNGKGEFTGTLPGDIKKGVFKGSIEVIKIELKGKATEPATGPLPRDFIVYYKKKNLGKLSAPDHFNCTATPTVKETGCFKHKCSVSLDRANKQCTDLISCHTIAEAVLTEWTAKVETISQEKVSEAIKNKSCTTDGEFIKGFDNTGAVDCDPPPPHPAKTCDPGEFVHKVNADGTVECRPACTGGKLVERTINGVVQRKCECTDPNKRWISYDNLWHSTGPGTGSYVKKSVFKCMSCNGVGAYWWRSPNGSYSCQCGMQASIKKKVEGMNVIAIIS